MRRGHWQAAQALLAICVLAGSAHAAQFAQVTGSGPAPAGGGLLRTLLSLALVLAVIFAAAWLLRRLRFAGTRPDAQLQIVAQLSLGTRERVVWIRAHDQELLVGVAPGQVRKLLQMPATPVALATHAGPTGEPADNAATRPGFAELLRRSLGK